MMYAGDHYDQIERDSSIRFNAVGLERTYSVEMFFEESAGSVTRISHKAFIRILESDSRGYLISLVMWNFRIKNREPDLVLEQLAEKCRRPIENLILRVSKKWQIADIENHEAILEKWHQAREILERDYSGEIFEKYLVAQDAAINNREVLLQKLKKDTFLAQFFSPVYNAAFSDSGIKTQEKVRFLNVDYDVDMVYETSDENPDEPFKVLKSLDQSSPKLRQMPVDHYTAKYELDERYAIKSIIGKFQNHNRKFSFYINEDSDASQ